MSVTPTITVTEAQWQDTVIDLALTLGWRVAHFRPARTVDGWRTPVAADGKGFPDLVLAREGDTPLFIELKTDTGRITPEQRNWLDTLGPHAHVIRPRDFPELRTLLARRGVHTR